MHLHSVSVLAQSADLVSQRVWVILSARLVLEKNRASRREAAFPQRDLLIDHMFDVGRAAEGGFHGPLPAIGNRPLPLERYRFDPVPCLPPGYVSGKNIQLWHRVAKGDDKKWHKYLINLGKGLLGMDKRAYGWGNKLNCVRTVVLTASKLNSARRNICGEVHFGVGDHDMHNYCLITGAACPDTCD